MVNRTVSEVSEEKKKKQILWILCLCQVGAMLIWYNFAAVLPILKMDWLMSNDQAGMLLSVFQLGYVAAVPFTGWLTDKYGGRIVFALSALETGLAGLGLIYFANDYTSALLWRALSGLGQGGLYVPGMQIISKWYSGAERGKAIGIYTCSSVAAYAAAYYLASSLAVSYSWQTGLLWTTVWAFPAALTVWFFIGDHQQTKMVQQNDCEKNRPAAFIKNKAVGLIIAGYIGHMWELYAFWGWIGAYLTYAFTIHGLPVSASVAYGGGIAAACTAMGGVSPGLMGWISDKYGRCHSTIVVLMISASCALAFGWLAEYSLWLLIPVGLIYGFFIVADSAIFKAGLTEIVPEKQLGSALGVQSVLGYGITVITPAIFGLIIDQYGWGWAFSFLALGPIIGAVCMFLLRLQPECAQMANGKG